MAQAASQGSILNVQVRKTTGLHKKLIDSVSNPSNPSMETCKDDFRNTSKAAARPRASGNILNQSQPTLQSPIQDRPQAPWKGTALHCHSILKHQRVTGAASPRAVMAQQLETCKKVVGDCDYVLQAFTVLCPLNPKA